MGGETLQDTSVVKGIVTEVKAATITDTNLLKIQDSEGKVWEFKADGFIGMSPSHLREHMLLGEPVEVHYRMEKGELWVYDVKDARAGKP